MSHKLLVEVCNLWDIVETDLIKTNWLPLCVDWAQRYVSEVSQFDNYTLTESWITKIYKQWADWTITATAPTGTVITDWYCNIWWTALIPATHILNAWNTSPIPAWAKSVVIKKTNAPWTVVVNWYTLTALNETYPISANDYDSNGRVWTLPAITITTTGGATYQRWRLI